MWYGLFLLLTKSNVCASPMVRLNHLLLGGLGLIEQSHMRGPGAVVQEKTVARSVAEQLQEAGNHGAGLPSHSGGRCTQPLRKRRHFCEKEGRREKWVLCLWFSIFHSPQKHIIESTKSSHILKVKTRRTFGRRCQCRLVYILCCPGALGCKIVLLRFSPFSQRAGRNSTSGITTLEPAAGKVYLPLFSQFSRPLL